MTTQGGGMRSTAAAGREGERIAREFLSSRGCTILETNYRFGGAEVDIIAREGNVLVFCEVKMRTGELFGLPEESVTPHKQKQVRRAALGYVATRGLGDRVCRFDVVAIEARGASMDIRHWRNAF
jgi:putative endonuclease